MNLDLFPWCLSVYTHGQPKLYILSDPPRHTPEESTYSKQAHLRCLRIAYGFL